MGELDEEALFRIVDEIRNTQANNDSDQNAAASTKNSQSRKPSGLSEGHMRAVVDLIRTRKKENRSTPLPLKRKVFEIAKDSADSPFSNAQKKRKEKARSSPRYGISLFL